jgi:hypothetical protein
MKTARVGWCVVTMTALLAGIWLAAPGLSQEKKPTKEEALREFMRKKLEASNQILEGLITEDAKMVAVGAQTLNEMSGAEKWRVSNDLVYRQFSEEFQRSTKKLQQAAEKGNFDDVALKWIDTTMGCVDCHKWVRGMRVADK